MTDFAGGLDRKKCKLEQEFGSTAAQASSCLMILSLIAIILPAVFILAINNGNLNSITGNFNSSNGTE
ncbi:1144_t:CDS:2, partial [Dentiscutata erythropus]